MEEQDIINIEMESMKNMISELLYEALKRKKRYCFKFKINRLNAVSDYERASIHLDMGVEADSQEFKRFCHNSTVLKTVVSTVLKLLCNDFAQKTKYSMIENIIKYFSKEKIDVCINDLNCNEKEKKFYTFINADIKMKREDIEYFLKNANLI